MMETRIQALLKRIDYHPSDDLLIALFKLASRSGKQLVMVFPRMYEKESEGYAIINVTKIRPTGDAYQPLHEFPNYPPLGTTFYMTKEGYPDNCWILAEMVDQECTFTIEKAEKEEE